MDQEPTEDAESTPDSGQDPAITGDALLAVTGIRGVLAKTPKRITVADKDRAEMLPREIRRAVRRFLEDDGGPRKLGAMAPFNYQWALDHVTEALEPHHLEAIAEAFRPEDHELALEYQVAAQRVASYLQSKLPIRTETTMAQSVNIDPSDTEIARFRRAFDVADNPMIVLTDMERGTLVSDQIDHLKACYPAGYELMKATMAKGMGDAIARKKSWQLPYRKDRLVQVLYQTTTWNAQLAKDLQASFAATDKPQQGPAPAKSQSRAAANVQTSTQAVAEGPAA